MDRTETAALLAVVAAYDRRSLSESDVLAWHEALHDLPAEHCRAAVAEHYRRETSWLMPAHVRKLVVAARNDAHQRALPAEGDAPRVPMPGYVKTAWAQFLARRSM